MVYTTFEVFLPAFLVIDLFAAFQ